MKSKRIIKWVDLAKAIAIVLMIIGHEIKNVWIVVFIFSFHMPLFFILSGYTSSEVHSVQKLKRNVKKLFLNSWLLASIMVVLLTVQQLIFNPNLNFWREVLKGIFWGSNFWGMNGGIYVGNVGVMWFMFAFFWAKIIYDFLQLLIPNKYNGIVLLVLTYASILLSKHYWLPQALDIAIVAAFFMWVGWVLRKKNIIQASVKNPVLIVSLVIWLVCVLAKIHIELSVRLYPLQLVSVVEAVAGSLVVMKLSQLLENNSLCLKFSTLGKHTLALLCIHHLDLYWVWWAKFIHSGLVAAVVRLIIDLVLLALWLYFQKIYRNYKLKNA